MRSLNIAPYPIPTGEFNCKESLIAVLFYKVTVPRELIARDALSTRIEAAPVDEPLLLEDADWLKCVGGLNASMESGDVSSTRDMVEFVRRLIDAPIVQVQVKESTP